MEGDLECLDRTTTSRLRPVLVLVNAKMGQ